ncbi:GH25 family lysozyme [Nocardioides sp. AE5]|uniref:glycoside hydrolase family 25 protein n=1 Tax=Nocardioides sp. AE5 TaxID=2962573 RepID=UPI0028822908|nr:GH25 family lysozyme [Nocardioides sp. AE5]MDT0202970.1 GH25 family lysozyme [Nocardioides sp. AE5]
MTVVRRVAGLVVACVVVAGCGQAGQPGDPSSGSPSPSPSATSAPPPASSGPSPSASEPSGSEPAEERHGIDVSHHQGVIDWERVAADGIEFAYLKATEGRGFTDPRFATNAHQARAAGIDVGGYHYYTLCAPPLPQAEHFVAVLGEADLDLAPVVDLELIGNCDPPPEKATLLAQVEAFIEEVEAATGEEVVVYFHPDFEDHYAMVEALERPLWVRRVGEEPPPGEWHLWQRSDRGRVDGITGPVDLDVMR